MPGTISEIGPGTRVSVVHSQAPAAPAKHEQSGQANAAVRAKIEALETRVNELIGMVDELDNMKSRLMSLESQDIFASRVEKNLAAGAVKEPAVIHVEPAKVTVLPPREETRPSREIIILAIAVGIIAAIQLIVAFAR